MDESSDAQFYSSPRFVTHIDDRCIDALAQYYADTLPDLTTKPRILDLCSSWISHLPETWTKDQTEVIGIGMNESELKENRVLSSYAVRDLNVDPSLDELAGCDSGSFDAVICAVSIDYMTKPRELMGEVARVSLPLCFEA